MIQPDAHPDDGGLRAPSHTEAPDDLSSSCTERSSAVCPGRPDGPSPFDRETAWLIERHDLDASPSYFARERGRHGWSASPHDAVRFPTKEAAEAECNGGHESGPPHAVEHMWVAAIETPSLFDTSGEVLVTSLRAREKDHDQLSGAAADLIEELLKALDWLRDEVSCVDPWWGKLREAADAADAAILKATGGAS